MSQLRSALSAAVVSLSLAACNPSSAIKSLASPEQDARARHYIQMLAEGQHDSLLAHTPPKNLAAAQAGLAKIDSFVARQRLDSVQLINANKTHFSNGRTVLSLTYEAKGEGRWMVFAVTTVDSANTWTIDGIRVDPVPGELSQANQFNLSGHSLKQYLFLLALILCVATTIGSAVYLATRHDFPNKWRWVFCSIIGVCSFQMNWATGDLAFRPLSFQLLAAGITQSGSYAPWIVTAALPIGAAIALRRYARARAAAGARNQALDA